MAKRKTKKSKDMQMNMDMDCNRGWKCGHGMGCGYFLGFIGALVYFLNTSTGFWNTILAILKAIVWPAFLVYHLFGL